MGEEGLDIDSAEHRHLADIRDITPTGVYDTFWRVAEGNTYVWETQQAVDKADLRR